MARDRLISEALRLFAHEGYAGTSVRAIVDAAGVTKPALYYHFGSKEGLYRHLLELHLEGWLGFVRTLAQAHEPVPERIRTYVRTAVRGAMENPDAVLFVHRACAMNELDWQAEEACLVESIVLQGIDRGELVTSDPRETTLALIAMIQWRCFASLHPQAPLSEQVADHIADIWLKGVSA